MTAPAILVELKPFSSRGGFHVNHGAWAPFDDFFYVQR